MRLISMADMCKSWLKMMNYLEQQHINYGCNEVPILFNYGHWKPERCKVTIATNQLLKRFQNSC